MAAGSQVALLAPTEILAVQHYRNVEPWLRAAGLPAALLTGETAASDRQNMLTRLADGSLPFIVGTHALLSEAVRFHDLRYILVDEQHRFGVEQRAQLVAKGVEPHVLYLSATPIPRTLAQSLYGDMDVLTLKEKPAGRLPVKTRLVPAARQPELMTFLYNEATSGNQVYWVVPRIDAAENPASVEAAGEAKEAVAAIETAVKRLRAVGN